MVTSRVISGTSKESVQAVPAPAPASAPAPAPAPTPAAAPAAPTAQTPVDHQHSPSPALAKWVFLRIFMNKQSINVTNHFSLKKVANYFNLAYFNHTVF